jgi:nitrate reductase NapE component
MELGLNIAWVVLAALMFCLWPRFAARTGPEPRTQKRQVRKQQAQNLRMQFVALAVLVLILFPVISVTDDLQALQNPAEADCCLRRVHVVPNTNSIFPPVAALPVPVFAELSFGFVRLATPGNLSAPVVDHPGLASIDNRPPPAA